MEKDADAYRTISEVSGTLDVPAHVLRFWESKFPQINPMKRGGGRRYYRRSDTDLLRAIRRLLYEEGYTIRGVQRLLRGRGATAVAGMKAGDRPADPALVAMADPRPETGSEPADPRTALSRLHAEIAACRLMIADAMREAVPEGRG